MKNRPRIPMFALMVVVSTLISRPSESIAAAPDEPLDTPAQVSCFVYVLDYSTGRPKQERCVGKGADKYEAEEDLKKCTDGKVVLHPPICVMGLVEPPPPQADSSSIQRSKSSDSNKRWICVTTCTVCDRVYAGIGFGKTKAGAKVRALIDVRRNSCNSCRICDVEYHVFPERVATECCSSCR